MIKFINILNSVISEQKRYKFSPDTYEKMNQVTDLLWSLRKNKFTKKTLIDEIPFQVADGTPGLVKIYINPRLPYIGFQDTKPKNSKNPMDIYIDLNPKHFDSKKNVYLTLYHEMIHSSDPTQSTKFNKKYQSTYDEKNDEKYWGHPIEFFAITNEFLEGLVNEFERRSGRIRNQENNKYLLKSLENLLNYFAKGEKLSKLSLDILSRINDEKITDDTISRIVGDISTRFPSTSEFLAKSKEDPYFLHYVQLIKKYNPKIWSRFLTMLFKTSEEIKDIINEKGT
jgi:hypothetical protein